MRPFEFEPVGIARTPYLEPAAVPRQPGQSPIRARIELHPGKGFEDALRDVDSWDHLWVIFVFDRTEGWKPMVTPPRSATKRGVFATRAPRRPNPIGMSAVRLLEVSGLTLHVVGLDLLDGTPVLDLKPYVPYADRIDEAGDGWLRAPDPKPNFNVLFDKQAEAQLQFCGDEGRELRQRLQDALSVEPQPHAYRRIRAEGSGFRIAVKAWRAHFTIEERNVRVLRISSGYRSRDLAREAPDVPPLHLAFVKRFGFSPA